MSGSDNDALLASYAEAPYESHAHPRSAPEHVAALGWLFGLDVPATSTARVLEIGCASGGNLVPFAVANPAAHVVGVDLSPGHIATGRARMTRLGIRNVDLRVADVAALDTDALGTFDYVVAHGVYSWVAPDVADALLGACARLLAPTGIAYLSYNTHPGWKAKEIVRDAMLLAAEGDVGATAKVRSAREMVEFLERVSPADGLVARALAEYRAMTESAGDYYLLHEELEEFNHPSYFRDVVAQARLHGLDYLADAEPEVMFAQNYGTETSEHVLGRYGHDQVLLEQHLDFVANRMFRQTLFVHAERAPGIRHRLDHGRFAQLHVASSTPRLQPPANADPAVRFYGTARRSFYSPDPVIAAAVDVLNDRWPWTIAHDAFLAATRERLRLAAMAEPPDLSARVDGLLEILIVQGHARPRLAPVMPPTGMSSMIELVPAVRALAEATRDDAQPTTFNSWHETVPLSAVDRYLVPLLDGRHDRSALLDQAMDVFGQGAIRIDRDDHRVADEATARRILADEVDALPRRLAELKLLDAAESRSSDSGPKAP